MRAFCPTVSLITLLCVGPAFGATGSVSNVVPFVACPNGLGSKPSGKSISLGIDFDTASKMALYAGAYIDLLAPRGWVCSSSYGNVNNSLVVYPPTSNPNTGPVVAEWRVITGFGGGRENLPIYGGRYFPKIVTADSVDTALNEYNETFNKKLTREQFLAPRYSTDKLTYLSSSGLQFWTPPNHRGLGSAFVGDATGAAGTTISPLPTTGLLILNMNGVGALVQVVTRLPPKLNELGPIILSFAKKCVDEKIMASCVSTDDYTNVHN